MEKITCDKCGEDITTRGAKPAWRLKLAQEQIPVDGVGEYSVMVHPPLGHWREHLDFCGMGCLQDWMESNDGN